MGMATIAFFSLFKMAMHGKLTVSHPLNISFLFTLEIIARNSMLEARAASFRDMDEQTFIRKEQFRRILD